MKKRIAKTRLVVARYRHPYLHASSKKKRKETEELFQ
jgi:hypothetical protein